MRDEINQNISRLIDDDLGYDESLILLDKIQTDETLKKKMARYQSISHALKNEEYLPINPDFSKNIFEAIQLEPAYLLPQRRQAKSNTKTYFAAAASALIAAILIGQNLQDRSVVGNNYQRVATTAAVNQSIPAAIAQRGSEKEPQHHPLTAQFNDYLQAHNSSVYTNGEANFHPYAKMAAYGKE
jgi:sigma-E factor negative regulatory protein RseA